MTKLNASRRQFLRTASVVSGSVGAAAAPFALNLATLGAAVAQTAPDYKAIVCMFLYGGNDSSQHGPAHRHGLVRRVHAAAQPAPDPIALLAPGHAGRTTAPTAGLAGAPRRRPADRAEVHASRPRTTPSPSPCIRCMTEVQSLFGAAAGWPSSPTPARWSCR